MVLLHQTGERGFVAPEEAAHQHRVLGAETCATDGFAGSGRNRVQSVFVRMRQGALLFWLSLLPLPMVFGSQFARRNTSRTVN